MKHKKRLASQKGFTLIELLVGMTIAVSLVGLIILLQVHLSEDQLFLLKKSLSNQGANESLTQIKKELRNVQPGENGDYPLFIAQDYQIGFYTDVDFDSEIERVRYFLQNGVLSKGTIEPNESYQYLEENEIIKIINEDVRNTDQPLFSFYNGNWPDDQENNPLETPAPFDEIKLIKIYLQINTEYDPNSDFISESFVSPRILKENL